MKVSSRTKMNFPYDDLNDFDFGERKSLKIDPQTLPNDDEVVLHERFRKKCAHRSFRVIRRERKDRDWDGLEHESVDDWIVCECGLEVYYRSAKDERDVSPAEVVMRSRIPRIDSSIISYQLLSRELRRFGWDVVTTHLKGGYRCRARKGPVMVETKDLYPSEAQALCRAIADIHRAGHRYL